jgi:hypothetical protein
MAKKEQRAPLASPPNKANRKGLESREKQSKGTTKQKESEAPKSLKPSKGSFPTLQAAAQ